MQCIRKRKKLKRMDAWHGWRRTNELPQRRQNINDKFQGESLIALKMSVANGIEYKWTATSASTCTSRPGSHSIKKKLSFVWRYREFCFSLEVFRNNLWPPVRMATDKGGKRLRICLFTSMLEHSCYLCVSFRVNLLTLRNRFVLMKVPAVRCDVPQIMVSVRH